MVLADMGPLPLHVAAAMDRAHPEYRGPSIEPTITSETDETQDGG